MNQETTELPSTGPRIPILMELNNTIPLNGDKSISGFNTCYKITGLTFPACDIIRLNDHQDMFTGKFLKKLTELFKKGRCGIPGVSTGTFRTNNQRSVVTTPRTLVTKCKR